MTEGIGWDFTIFWEIGRAILSGGDPYAVAFSRYPPAAAFSLRFLACCHWGRPSRLEWGQRGVLSPRAVPPEAGAVGMGLAAVHSVFVQPADRPFVGCDLLVGGPIPGAKSPSRGAGAGLVGVAPGAGRGLNLKPQLALIVLPWNLLRWLRAERGLLRWAGLCVPLYVLPLCYDLQIYSR